MDKDRREMETLSNKIVDESIKEFYLYALAEDKFAGQKHYLSHVVPNIYKLIILRYGKDGMYSAKMIELLEKIMSDPQKKWLYLVYR